MKSPPSNVPGAFTRLTIFAPAISSMVLVMSGSIRRCGLDILPTIKPRSDATCWSRMKNRFARGTSSCTRGYIILTPLFWSSLMLGLKTRTLKMVSMPSSGKFLSNSRRALLTSAAGPSNFTIPFAYFVSIPTSSGSSLASLIARCLSRWTLTPVRSSACSSSLCSWIASSMLKARS